MSAFRFTHFGRRPRRGSGRGPPYRAAAATLAVLLPALSAACSEGAAGGLDPPRNFACEVVGPSFVQCEWQSADPAAGTEIWVLDGNAHRWYFYEVLDPGMTTRTLRRENCPTRYRARHVIDGEQSDWSRSSQLFGC